MGNQVLNQAVLRPGQWVNLPATMDLTTQRNIPVAEDQTALLLYLSADGCDATVALREGSGPMAGPRRELHAPYGTAALYWVETALYLQTEGEDKGYIVLDGDYNALAAVIALR